MSRPTPPARPPRRRRTELLTEPATTHPGHLWTARLDMTGTEAIRSVVTRAFAELGRIDVIFSNAGSAAWGAAEELTDAVIADQIAVNLRGLERNDATPGEIESHREKAVALREALSLPDEHTAVDVVEIVVAIATAWLGVPDGPRAVGGPDPVARQASHRAVVVAAVTAIRDALAS